MWHDNKLKGEHYPLKLEGGLSKRPCLTVRLMTHSLNFTGEIMTPQILGVTAKVVKWTCSFYTETSKELK